MTFTVSQLTFRQRQVAFGICCGMPNEVIAEALGLKVESINTIVCELLKEMKCATRVEFAVFINARTRELYRRSYTN